MARRASARARQATWRSKSATSARARDDDWRRTLNYNEFNIVENGFLNEFRQAQANLQANIAAGRGNTFAYTGAPGTAPLPMFLAFFNGQNAANAGNPARLHRRELDEHDVPRLPRARRTRSPFSFASASTSSTTTGLHRQRDLPRQRGRGGPAGELLRRQPGPARRRERHHQHRTRRDYDSLQIELRRRLSQGLQFQASYVFGNALQSHVRLTFRRPQPSCVRDAGDPGDITHAFKTNVVYDLPFGRGRRFGGNANGVVERLIGGWQLGVASSSRAAGSSTRQRPPGRA